METEVLFLCPVWSCSSGLSQKEREHATIKPQHKGYSTIDDSTSDSESLGNVGAFAASVGSTSRQMDEWLIDSGASSHMTWEKNILTSYKEFEKVQKVSVGEGRTLDAVGIGDVHVNMLFKVSQPKRCHLSSALCTSPGL